MSIQCLAKAWDMGLPPTQKLILLKLADNANDKYQAWPSVSTISRFTGLSLRAVQINLKELVEKGILSIGPSSVAVAQGYAASVVYTLSYMGSVVTPPPIPSRHKTCPPALRVAVQDAFGGCSVCGGEGEFRVVRIIPGKLGGEYTTDNVTRLCVSCSVGESIDQAKSLEEMLGAATAQTTEKTEMGKPPLGQLLPKHGAATALFGAAYAPKPSENHKEEPSDCVKPHAAIPHGYVEKKKKKIYPADENGFSVSDVMKKKAELQSIAPKYAGVGPVNWWVALLAFHHPKTFAKVTNVGAGQLKGCWVEWGDEAPKVMEVVMKAWLPFTNKATEHGAFNCPLHPNIPFLRKFSGVAYEFYVSKGQLIDDEDILPDNNVSSYDKVDVSQPVNTGETILDMLKKMENDS